MANPVRTWLINHLRLHYSECPRGTDRHRLGSPTNAAPRRFNYLPRDATHWMAASLGDYCVISPAAIFLMFRLSIPTLHRNVNIVFVRPWWRHQMEPFSALLALCVGNSPVTGEFPSHRPVTRGFGVFFDLCLYKRVSKQSRRGDLRRHLAHYDVTVMHSWNLIEKYNRAYVFSRCWLPRCPDN